MRVAIDGRTIQDHFPGIGRYTYNLVEALAGLDDAPDLVLLYDPAHPSSRFSLDTLGAGRRVELVPVALTPFDSRSQLAIPRLLWAMGVDLFHATYFVMPYWAGRPTVVTLYDTIPLIYPQYMPSRLARWAYRWLNTLAGRRARRVLAISASAAGDLTHHLSIPPACIAVTPLAADARFRPIAERGAVERWRAVAGLPQRYALYLGINKPHKNVVRLIEAWDHLRRAWPAGWGQRPALVLAGREDRRYPQAHQAVEAAGLEREVLFLPDPPDADLPLLYNGAEVFVFPSLYEGFGLPVLEAMACGTAVACSDRSSLPEIAGAAAELFDPEDATAIAESLRRLLGDAELRRLRAAEGLQRAGAYSWERTARLTLAAYRA